MNIEARTLDDFDHWLGRGRDPAWLLVENRYDPSREAEVEACLSIGNGFLGVRGSRAISRGPTWITYQQQFIWASWPRTYVAGLFDTPDVLPAVPALVPAPDWLRLRIWVAGEPTLMRFGDLLNHRRTLDMRRGVLLTEWEQRHQSGRVVRLKTLRLVSLADRALALQLLKLDVDGEPADVRLEASFESVGSALDLLRLERDAALYCTANSGKTLAIAARASLDLDGAPARSDRGDLRWNWMWRTGTEATNAWPTARFVRVAAFAKGDLDAAATVERASDAIGRAERAGWSRLIAAHEQAWADRWRLSDVVLSGDEKLQQALRFAIYHLNSVANPGDERVSIGARALTGDAYLGHVFWDTEIYLLPFYIFTWPEAARALLMYRYHTLPGARAKARRFGYRGALYAWESADTGEEMTPENVIDAAGRTIPVLCGLEEHHISADVAFAVWQYWQATEDCEFFLPAGAEILLETARFWASRAQIGSDGLYHIRRVIGPDEYHETIDDNAYTNGMAAWTIARGLETVSILRESWPDRYANLARRLAIDGEELAHWADVAARLMRGFDSTTGLIEQFTGYFALEDIDLGAYSARTVPMDVILGRERTQRSQVVKQADVVALLALLPGLYDRPTQLRNFAYYEARCAHGSSLSTAMHALVAARLGELATAERYFRLTAEIDLNSLVISSAGGVHIAALGGLWLAAIFGFAGFEPRGDTLVFNPVVPKEWRSFTFRIAWRSRRFHVAIDPARGTFTATLEEGDSVTLKVGSRNLALAPGESASAPYREPADRAASDIGA